MPANKKAKLEAHTEVTLTVATDSAAKATTAPLKQRKKQAEEPMYLKRL